MTINSTDPAWIQWAHAHKGLREIPGARHEPRIAAWLTKLGAWWRDDETPWCGTFVAAAFDACGVPVARNWFRAKAWLDWGVPLAAPIPGAVVVFSRDGGGHVGFAVGKDTAGRLLVLGGNQGNAVSIAAFDVARAIGYRWPAGVPLPLGARLVVSAARGAASSNEA